MKFTVHKDEPYDDWPEARVQIGLADWHDDGETDLALRYVWPDRNGNLTQTRTIPIGVAEQAQDMLAKETVRATTETVTIADINALHIVDGDTRRRAQEDSP